MDILRGVECIDWAVGAMTGCIPGNVCLLSDRTGWRSESLALFHGGIERVPGPVLGSVHVAKHGAPSIDLNLTGAGQVQAIDGGGAYREY